MIKHILLRGVQTIAHRLTQIFGNNDEGRRGQQQEYEQFGDDITYTTVSSIESLQDQSLSQDNIPPWDLPQRIFVDNVDDDDDDVTDLEVDTTNSLSTNDDTELDDDDGNWVTFDDWPSTTIEQPELRLEDLPSEILDTILSYSSSLSDRPAVACTSKKFHDAAYRSVVLQTVSLKSARRDSGIVTDETEMSEFVIRLLPFAMAGNLEALLYLGRIALYAQYDKMTGVSVLKRAALAGSCQAKYELAVLLRDSEEGSIGQRMREQYLQEAAAGSYQAQLEIFERSGAKYKGRQLLIDSKEEMRRNNSLSHLCHTAKYLKSKCDNRLCFRTSPKRRMKELSPEWLTIQQQVLGCGVDVSEMEEMAFSERFHMGICEACHVNTYCTVGCARLGWRAHWTFCRRHPHH